jgi:hypothetical protein
MDGRSVTQVSHQRGQAGCNGVTKFSRWRQRMVVALQKCHTSRVRQAATVLQQCHTSRVRQAATVLHKCHTSRVRQAATMLQICNVECNGRQERYTSVTPAESGRLQWCYKIFTLAATDGSSVTKVSHQPSQAGCNGVTTVSHQQSQAGCNGVTKVSHQRGQIGCNGVINMSCRRVLRYNTGLIKAKKL